MAEERVNELKDRAMEMTKNEKWEKQILKNKQYLVRLDRMIKHTGILAGGEGENRAKKNIWGHKSWILSKFDER